MVMEEQQSDMELDSERVPVPQVQKPVEDVHVETVNKITSISRGKPRLRKKALHAAIVKQMEFYFSDANLSKDRFLSNLIKEDPYVDLCVFLSFNKIKELTTDINRLTKALQASTILSLSEDGMKVCRVTPIVPKENIEECTIYVQNLLPDTDHERLSSIFSQYGQVVYVSLPRFKNNRKIKGFAFVEFDTPESAKKCLEAFQKKGCMLPSYTTPDELLSITTFEDKDAKVVQDEVKQDNESNSIENIPGNEKPKEEETDKDSEKEEESVSTNNTVENHENKSKKKAKKRKYKDGESSESTETEKLTDNESVKNKKKKFKHSNDAHGEETELSNEKHSDVSLEGTPKKTNRCKRSVSINEEVAPDNCRENEQMVIYDSPAQTTEEQDNTSEKKKKRKKRKKRSQIEDFSYSMALQVMAKKDWKHLRNKYLELQRSKMKQLKQHLRKTWKERWSQWSNYDKNKFEKEENEEKDKTGKQDTTNATSACRFSFTPGVIVKIEMDKPCTDPKTFKTEIKNSSSVKYIDVEDGSCIAYVRCDTNENAQAFTQKSDEGRHMTIIEGEEEKMYWDKILRDRKEKLGSKVKTKQRGRTKLLKKAEKELGKHIRFDEV